MHVALFIVWFIFPHTILRGFHHHYDDIVSHKEVILTLSSFKLVLNALMLVL